MNNAKTINKDTDSPCIGTCSAKRGNEVCVGCYRSFDEILMWHTLTDDEKRSINRRIEASNSPSSQFLE